MRLLPLFLLSLACTEAPTDPCPVTGDWHLFVDGWGYDPGWSASFWAGSDGCEGDIQTSISVQTELVDLVDAGSGDWTATSLYRPLAPQPVTLLVEPSRVEVDGRLASPASRWVMVRVK